MQQTRASRLLATSTGVVVLAFTSFSQLALAQKGGSGAPSSSSGAGSAGSASNPGFGTGTGTRGTVPGNIGNSPNSNGNWSNNNPNNTRPMFFSGKVMMDDGTQPNTDIRIERVCGGRTQLESHTDSKGHFSFQLGQNASLDTDASDTMSGSSMGRMNGQPSSSPSFGGMNGASNNLWNCELRAAYPGYRSDVVELGTRRSMDDPDIGTIILHRMQNVRGTTISLTTALAPKHAVKDYEKGMQLAQKGKFDEAEQHLKDATDVYPKYALAWFALGQLEQRNRKPDDARKSFEAAIAADKKFVSPYDQLALLSAQSGKWEDAAAFSEEVISLNPVEFPSAFWYNAVANYNLKKPAEAEKSAKDLIKLDTPHKYPEAENLLAQINLEKGNYPEAATHLRTYLAMVPNAKNADALKQALLKIDQANAEAKK